jgi:hypothetical protein
MPDITGAINQFRRILEAIADGRVEARTVAGMTDEQLEEYNARLTAEAEAEVQKGYDLHKPAE